nr:CapA family protein [uncultured Blautia sp.]
MQKRKKKDYYKRSKAYRRRQARLRQIYAAIAGVLLLVVLILLVRSCSQKDAKSADSSAVAASDAQSTDKATAKSEAASDSSDNAVKGESAEDNAAETAHSTPVTLTVSVVGDCTLGTDENFDYDTSLNAYFESYGKEYFFQNVKSIFEADDLTIANNEGTFTDSYDREDKTFAFKAPASFAGIYSCSSVEAVNTANNHSHDYGEQSFQDTMKALDAEGVVHFGYDETAVMDIKGVKVGLVGIYELYDHLEREQQLKDNIAKVKKDGAELIIVIFHWGNEKETVPDSNQTTLGHLAIDLGADLVCGHHPHVLQGIEEYKGRNIVYSLGNFCFGGNSSPSDMDSMIFQQTFTITSDGVKADNVTNIIPCSISSEYGYNDYQPTPAEGDEKTRIMEKIQERSSWIG